MAHASRVPCWASRCRLNSYRSIRSFQSFSAAQSQISSYPLYPSVSQLLHEKGIPDSEISKIPASGPKGRLLKGDVLAYTGAIPAEYTSNLSAHISKLAHLDLSNIKIKQAPAQREAKPAPEAPEAPEAPAEKPAAAPPKDARVTLPINLDAVHKVQKRIQKALKIMVHTETFITRAANIANEDLPPSAVKPRAQSADELFDEIVGIGQATKPSTSRGNYVPEISTRDDDIMSSLLENEKEGEEDIIDVLSGKSESSPVSRNASSLYDSLDHDIDAFYFSVEVPAVDRRRGEAFLERLRDVLENNPGSLIFETSSLPRERYPAQKEASFI
ncbi:hypothetical protein AJ79_02773 [Helicocarpus griseus UAMH5409]|uniref:Peripheral subunit-binding (PSBD) domain-containing protein n=1 Tax=Helicocarpus griseus UAMH5409 TaxID=1447875 RepID=A0A2B7Y0U9_9EURO|nr:hypothetical protein AJ79_02773 [Helicocarpus griseus UAMH5409]